MPTIIILNSDQTGIEVKLIGNVTGQEIISVNEEASKYSECTYQIWNFMEAESVEIFPDDMHRIAISDSSASLKLKIEKVAIVGSKDVLRGVDQMYETFSTHWVGRPGGFISRTFTTMNEANEWVNNNEE